MSGGRRSYTYSSNEPETTTKKVSKVGSGGGSGGGSTGDSCLITLVTTLNSVDLSVLTTIQVGQVLDLQRTTDGSSSRLGAFVLPAQRLAGVITATEATQLLECLRKGYHYDVIVLEIRGGLCKVEIRPRA